jgi:hypothetical protein
LEFEVILLLLELEMLLEGGFAVEGEEEELVRKEE